MNRRRILLNPLSYGVAVVALTAAYLAGPARDNMDAASAAAVLIHISVGCLLIAPVAWAILLAFKRRRGSTDCLLLVCVSLLVCVCAVTGIYETVRAAARCSTAGDNASITAHILSGILAIAVALICCWRFTHRPDSPDEQPKSRLTDDEVSINVPNPIIPRSASPPELGGGHPLAGRAKAKSEDRRANPLLALFALISLAQGGLFGAAALLPTYNAQDYYRDLTATTAAQAQNPLFPAGLRLQSGAGDIASNSHAVTLPSSAACGATGCHPSAYREWHASAHRFAGSDPLYTASVEESARTSGPEIRIWCQGCHAPGAAIRQSLRPVDPGLKSEEAEGVGCYACHAAAGAPTRTGNGRIVLAEPRDYPFAGAKGWRGSLHDFLLRVRPAPHQRAFLKPELHRSSEFCSSCHRQSLTLAQNHYQFVRGPDEYGEWARGPASGRSARSGEGRAARTCQDCHFRAQAAGAGVRVSHAAPGGISTPDMIAGRSAGSDAAGSQLRKAITLDLIAIRPIRPDGLPGDTIAPLNSPRKPYVLVGGTPCLLDIVVRNQGVGHSFPAGYTDLTEAWLEVKIANADGELLLSNGVIADAQAAVPRNAHFYGSLGLDKQGEPILRHNLPAKVTQAYHRAIPAGGADVARYRFVLPTRTRMSGPKPGAIRISARLRYRSVRPDFLRWAHGKEAKSENGSTGEQARVILTLAETEVRLPLTLNQAPPGIDSSAEKDRLAERFLHYGDGLIASKEKPDLGTARYAFGHATELSPARPDPWIGLGRVFLREPDLRLAEQNFEKARVRDPGNPAAIAELSVVYSKQGQPERAISALMPLAAAFPSDAEIRNDLGMAQFRAGMYAEAAETFRKSLAIDPDQYFAHFQLKRCCEVLRRVPEGRLEDSITRYMAEDLLAARLVPAYLKKHPEDASRAEPFPIHELR